MTGFIDLRSDTVTRPTEAMRSAMMQAEVGDDVYGEDPTVNALEALTADMLGHEAGLFLPSGTQSNLVALLTHCGRGDEYIVGATAHTYQYEGGGAAALGGIQPQPLPFERDGTVNLDRVRELVKPLDPHFARSRLLCLENTQGGRPSGPEYFSRARALCDEMSLSLHLDGARLFNAAVATSCRAADIAGQCDSVSVCLSKGLGAPVGSVLVADQAFIGAARRWRKMVGGGMRQAGILAAAGIHALNHHVERLAEDHDKAARLAALVNQRYQGAATHHTNMVFVDLPDEALTPLREKLKAAGVVTRGPRWVLHLDVSFEDVERVGQLLESS
jgi:threonine aldolase